MKNLSGSQEVPGTKGTSFLRRLWREEEGQDLTEYGLLLVLISLAAVVAMGSLATAINAAFGRAANNLSTAS